MSYEAAQEDVAYEGIYPVPQLWSEADFHLPDNGRGVYRTTLQLNAPLSRLGLTLPHSNMARKISVFSPEGVEEVVFDSGNTELENRALAPMRMPVITLPDLVTGSELVITIRNSESVHGGIEDDVTLGPVDTLVRGEQKLIIYAMTIATVLIVFFFVNRATTNNQFNFRRTVFLVLGQKGKPFTQW